VRRANHYPFAIRLVWQVCIILAVIVALSMSVS
jgi:hypothetical protein